MSRSVHVRSHSTDHVAIEGITVEESQTLQGMVNGHCWVRTDPATGRLLSVPATRLLPDPMIDPDMTPYWNPHPKTDGVTAMARYNDTFQNQNAGIMIQSLGAYNPSKEVWRAEAAKLTSYGFVCMRSPRGADGKYWEGWYLPCLYSARGNLAKTLENIPAAEKLERAIGFLCHHCHVGTIDAIVQKAGAVHDDCV